MQSREPQTEFLSSQNLTIFINQTDLLCKFTYANKIQSYRKDSIINITCKDLDIQYQWKEDPDLKIDVSCIDLAQNGFCKDVNNKKVQVNKTDTIQIIPKPTAQPYSIVLKVQIYIQFRECDDYIQQIFKFLIIKKFSSCQKILIKKNIKFLISKIIIAFLDNDIQILDVKYNEGYTIRLINNYKRLKFNFNIIFENRFYLLQFSIAIIYQFELIKILEPQYYQYHFRLFDHYQQFNQGNKFNLKFLVQFKNDILPNQYDLELTQNQPPICQIKFGSKSIDLEKKIKLKIYINIKSNNFDFSPQKIKSLFRIIIKTSWLHTSYLIHISPKNYIQALQQQKMEANCELQLDSPFIFQFRYFLQNQDYKNFLNQSSDYSLILYSYQKSNSFDIYLPQSEGIALIQIRDSRGSVTNIESQLNVTEFTFNCSDYLQKNLCFEVMMNHYNQSDCFQLTKQLFEDIKNYLNSEDLSDQLLSLQTIKLYKRIIINQNNLNSSTRRLTEESCYSNQTKLMLFNNSQVLSYSTKDIVTFEQEFFQFRNSVSKLLLKKTNLENEIKQNDIIMNELLFQQKESILNSLEATILFVDDLFQKISETSFKSEEDKEQIVILSEKLIHIMDDIVTIISTSVLVNGQQFTLNGQQVRYQLSKITKEVFNKQEGLESDVMDSLIGFVQKEQLDLKFNYLSISHKLLQQLTTFLNSFIEIEQKFYTKTKLQYYLYKNQYKDQLKLQKPYVIDILQYTYCQDKFLPEINFQCFLQNNNGSFQLCQILIQETINNQSI